MIPVGQQARLLLLRTCVIPRLPRFPFRHGRQVAAGRVLATAAVRLPKMVKRQVEITAVGV